MKIMDVRCKERDIRCILWSCGFFRDLFEKFESEKIKISIVAPTQFSSHELEMFIKKQIEL